MSYRVLRLKEKPDHSISAAEKLRAEGYEVIESEESEETGVKEIEAWEIVDNIDSAVIRFNEKGEITFFSKGAEQIFGYRADEIVGRSALGTIVPYTDSYGRDHYKIYEEVIARPHEYSYNENENVCKDGTRLWMSWKNKVVRDNEGELLYVQSIGYDITERKKAERELEENKNRYRAMVENINDALFVHDFEGTVRYVNQNACLLLDYTCSELVGLSLDTIHTARSRHRIEKVMQEKEWEDTRLLESEILRKNGDIVPVEINSKVVSEENKGEIVSIVRDITERKQAERELQNAHEQLYTILENQDAGVFVVSQHTMDILYANSFIRETYNDELVGKNCSEIHETTSNLCGQCKEHIQTGSVANEGEALSTELYLGETGKWFLMQVRPIQWIDDSPAILHLLADITPLKEAERLREDISRITRHDLKTPLNGIIGFAQLLAHDEDLSERHRENASIIESSGKRMLRMIDESLSLYKMEKGSYELSPKKVDLGYVLPSVKVDLQGELRMKDLRIIINGREDTSPGESGYTISGEYLLCYTLFSNLISNAVEASEKEDSIRIDISKDKNGWVSVSIWNRAPIPEKVRERFGEKYATLGKERGTGLGVYSARLMVETMGGRFGWNSSEEEGTTVVVSLPQADDNASRSG